MRRLAACALLILQAGAALAGPAADLLPAQSLQDALVPAAPVANAAFAPGADARAAAPFTGMLHIAAASMQVQPALVQSVVGGRDALRFPALALEFFSVDELLVPVQRGQMVAEATSEGGTSYWRVIPQLGRRWREPGDGEWSRAAFPLMLVNDTENHAHQGLATFLYRDDEVSALRFQFVQQTAPYLLAPHCVFWGVASARFAASAPVPLAARQAEVRRELAERLPARPLAELRTRLAPGTLEGFGGPLLPAWQVALGLLYEGTLWYEALPTAQGEYPYPLEMRFGVRSVMKSVSVPLALLRLAELYGPQVLELRIGDYVPGLHPKWQQVRFIDAADLASGFGGTGSLVTEPNDINDGYLEADYDGWYTAPSVAGKIDHINTHLSPYPWAPGTVMRYRDQDHFLLGIAVDAYLKTKRGADADAWRMLEQEVFRPIGIHHAPAVRTREPGGRDGAVWFSAGYYPTLDDLAKIALLYQRRGMHDGRQLLHRELTADLLAATGALDKQRVNPLARVEPAIVGPATQLYRMGFHYTPWTGSRSGRRYYLPTMSGFGDNEVILFPREIVALRMAKAVWRADGPPVSGEDIEATLRAVDRLAGF